jgi:hypothetical protein
MDILNNYNEKEINDMIRVYETHKKNLEYKRNYYRNKYNQDEEYKIKKKESNKKYMRNLRNQKKV